MATHTDPHQRGYLLQELMNCLFDLYKIPIVRSFTRNSGGEQIDGAFTLDGRHYLTECRWRTKLSDVRDVDGLLGQVQRSGKQTMGLYLSINGWSENVIPLLKQNIDKSIVLMEGHDLRIVMANPVNLQDFMKAKTTKLNLEAEPYLSINEYISGLKNRG